MTNGDEKNRKKGMAPSGSPPEFKLNDNLNTFKKKMTQFFKVNEIKNEQKAIAIVIIQLENTVLETLCDLCYPEEPEDKPLSELWEILELHFGYSTSIFNEHTEFYEATQEAAIENEDGQKVLESKNETKEEDNEEEDKEIEEENCIENGGSSRNDKNRARGSNNERSKRSENGANENKKVEENSNCEATDKESRENAEKEEDTTNGDNQENKPEGGEIVCKKIEIDEDHKEKETKADEESKEVEEPESKEEAPKIEDSRAEEELKDTEIDEEMKEESKEDEGKKAEDKEESKEDQLEDSKNKDLETKTETMEVEEAPVQEIPKHIFRVGWSVLSSGLQLGEAEHSYGYESSGKFVSNKQFVDYGVKFGVGDVVGAYLDVGEDAVTLIFTHNDESLGVAKTIPKDELGEEFVLFPHILIRNCSFELNLGAGEEPWTAHPEELNDYFYLEKIEEKVLGPLRPELRGECEVIMMCELPASGKTFWVKKLVEENRCRNFIIDQTNVFQSAQRRKMQLFEGYKRRAVVVVVADEEQTKRRALQEAQDGKDVPDSAILEMKANMNLPRPVVTNVRQELTKIKEGREQQFKVGEEVYIRDYRKRNKQSWTKANQDAK